MAAKKRTTRRAAAAAARRAPVTVGSARTSERRSRFEAGVAAAIIVVATFVVYAPVLGGDFIWDDDREITNNLAMRSVRGLWTIWTGGAGIPDYFPLKTSALWLQYRLFGVHAPPYHVVNVGLHAACAVLVWRVLRRLGIAGAWLAGLVFAIHPTHVESVAWISECKNTLSTLFALLTLLAWFDHDDNIAPTTEKVVPPRRAIRDDVLALMFFVAALLCKTQVVVLPIVLLLCTWWRRRSVGEPARRVGFPRDAVRRTLPFFAAALVFGIVTVWFQHGRAIGGEAIPAGGLRSRIANAGKATWWYLGKAISPTIPWSGVDRGVTLWPPLAIYPPWPTTPPVWIDFLPAVAMIGLLAGLAGVAARNPERGRGALFALAIFLLTLSPVLGLVQMSYMRLTLVADHFQYLPDIGILAFCCAGAAWAWRRASRRIKPALVAVAVTIVCGYAVSALARAAVFKDEYTLWTDTLSRNPGAWLAHNRLGAVLFARGDFPEAAAHFAEAVRLKPDDPDSHNNLGLEYASQGKVDQAIAEYRTSLRLNSLQASAHANLGNIFVEQKQFVDAIAEYRQALRLDPQLVTVLSNLGYALLETDHVDEAIATLQKAIALDPELPEAKRALDYALRLREASR